jgi:mannitol/fructose-specific phosphotransferase system IIA component (Ntr-type)
VVFGRSRSGVVFDSATDPVHLIFLLVTPADQPQVQVLILGEVAALAGDGGLRDALMQATSTAEVRELLRRHFTAAPGVPPR